MERVWEEEEGVRRGRACPPRSRSSPPTTRQPARPRSSTRPRRPTIPKRRPRKGSKTVRNKKNIMERATLRKTASDYFTACYCSYGSKKFLCQWFLITVSNYRKIRMSYSLQLMWSCFYSHCDEA
jgi:hypothetical protein